MVASFVLSIALGTSPAIAEVRIENFKSGLACTRSTQVKGRSGWICQPTELVLVTDQGDCVYDGRDELCTWVGFEFDYVSTVPAIKLQCESTSSVPGNEGNFEGVHTKQATRYEWELALPEQSGHLYHPQYYVMNLQSADAEDVIHETACSHKGKELFRARFKVHFPLVPSK
jgi:hypothetical protein